jgi:hypothetical protein
MALGQSHPTWWGLASPDATSLVGIRWETLKTSPFAEAVGAELGKSGSLGFPGLTCLLDARQILISSPEILAVLSGSFSAKSLRQEASSKGLKPVRYRGIDLWISPGKETLSVAQLSEQVVLVGMRTTLEAAVDRSLTDTSAVRSHSALLNRGGRFADTSDLWVVSNQLPDPLANIFVPLDIDARSFDGMMSLRTGLRAGLHVEATLNAVSPSNAQSIADDLRDSIPELPAVARGLQVKTTAGFVQLSLDMTGEQFEASLRHPAAAPAAPVVAKEVAPVPPPPRKPEGPQIVRIFGLDDGPREIVLDPR